MQWQRCAMYRYYLAVQCEKPTWSLEQSTGNCWPEWKIPGQYELEIRGEQESFCIVLVPVAASLLPLDPLGTAQAGSAWLCAGWTCWLGRSGGRAVRVWAGAGAVVAGGGGGSGSPSSRARRAAQPVLVACENTSALPCRKPCCWLRPGVVCVCMWLWDGETYGYCLMQSAI